MLRPRNWKHSSSGAAQKAVFDVFIDFDDFRAVCDPSRDFLRLCRPIASCWKILTLTESKSTSRSSSNVDSILASLQMYADGGVEFTRLEELHARGQNNDYLIDSKVTLSWVSPNLRTLRCSHFLPSPANIFSSSDYIGLCTVADGKQLHSTG